jgi:hypothetical protein
MNKLIAQASKTLLFQTTKLTFATKTPQKKSESTTAPTENVLFDPMITVTKRNKKAPAVDPYKKKYFEKETGTFQEFFYG